MKKTIAIYPGRFQPFHKGHHSAYEALVRQFGEENVFIATSGKTEAGKSPFTFDEKVNVMTRIFNIPSDRIVKVKNPYNPEEILTKYDPNSTVFVTAMGKKDAGRLGGNFFRPYREDEEQETLSQRRGYYIEVPNFEIDGEVMSATKIRDMLGNPAVSTREKIDFFKKIYGKYDNKTFRMVRDIITRPESDIPKSKEPVTATPKQVRRAVDLTKKIYNPVTRRNIRLKTALQYDKDHPAYKSARKLFTTGTINEVFNSVLIENALINQYNSLVDKFIVGETEKNNCRINPTDSYADVERKCKAAYTKGVFYYPLLHALSLSTPSNTSSTPTEPASDAGSTSDMGGVSEAMSSTERVRRYYKRHPEKVRAYLKKTQDDRVARNRDRAKAVKKYGEQKMKNHDVHHPNGAQNGNWKLAKKDHGRDKVNESLLVEGGAAGHMRHPYEDVDMSFADYKNIIDRGIVGGLSKEEPVSEKLDGQNIAFTMVGNEIRFARNKGHVKSKAQNALTVTGMADKFKGRGGIEKAFVGAARDLEKAMKSLSPEQIKTIFGDGSKFMSVEIILPDSENVIPYDKSVLVLHGTIEYDENGNKIGASTDTAKQLSDELVKIGSQQQKIFGIQGPQLISFNDVDIEKQEDAAESFKSQVDTLRDKYNLNDDDLVREYYIKWWEDTLKERLDKEGISYDDELFDRLVQRFAFDDKSLQIKDIKDAKLKQWVSKFEKEELNSLKKESQRPFEILFLQVGATVLQRVQGLMAANNPEASEKIKKELQKIAAALRGLKPSEQADKLEQEFQRLDQIGIDKMVPSEGIVFIYNGRPYKFTGAFAPINQILGTFKFGMKGAPSAPAPAAPVAAKAPSGLSASDKRLIKQYYDKTIVNPLTGRTITIQSALTYNRNHPARKLAMRFLSSQLGKK